MTARVLFTSHKIGHVKMPSRFKRSATWDAFANLHGTPQEPSLRSRSHLARGGVGLIVPSAMSDDPRFATTTTFGMWNEAHVECWRPVVDSIHSHGSKVFFQLFIPA
jgi:2,4-dienoyl-CoA reductase-like NADH-dependent reductase (Old Yellow Enzyme family)